MIKVNEATYFHKRLILKSRRLFRSRFIVLLADFFTNFNYFLIAHLKKTTSHQYFTLAHVDQGNVTSIP